MSVSLLKQQSYEIAKNAFFATFINSRDDNNVIHKFADTWSTKFSKAIQKYVTTCIGLPVGGPVTSGELQPLEMDLYNAAKDALKATYLTNDYDNEIEIDFANGIKTASSSIVSYMGTVITVPASPPTIPLSPGGLLITTPSSQCVPAFYSAAIEALTNTFQNGDVGGVAQIFASIFQNTGNLIGEYVSTCSSLTGGGNLIAS